MNSPNQFSVSPPFWRSLRRTSILSFLTILGAASWCSAQDWSPILTPEEQAAQAHDSFLEEEREKFAMETKTTETPNKEEISVSPVALDLPVPLQALRRGRSPWQRQIRATVFWVGEKPTTNNPTSNVASSWDPNWEKNFGGYDHPFKREGYRPAAFEPKLNPFYVALPYNDLVKGREHRPEASHIIPWFWREYRGPGISVCADRWLAIHYQGKVCYAQWKDVGPFTIDDGKYVFEGERPRPNRNHNAGIDISPSVRDFLELRTNADVDWRFVEEEEIPAGPWSKWLKPPPPDLPTRSAP